jgi:hypothetical protein
MRWRGPAEIVNDKPVPSSERMICKDYDRKCSIKKYSGLESQGAWCQDEMIGCKAPVVK